MQKKLEDFLEEYLISRLDELRETYFQEDNSEFYLGEAYAYVECLEVILEYKGADNETLLSIEERYGIK